MMKNKILGDANYLDGSLHGDDCIDSGTSNDSLYGDDSTTSNDKLGDDYLDGGTVNNDQWRNAA